MQVSPNPLDIDDRATATLRPMEESKCWDYIPWPISPLLHFIIRVATKIFSCLSSLFCCGNDKIEEVEEVKESMPSPADKAMAGLQNRQQESVPVVKEGIKKRYWLSFARIAALIGDDFEYSLIRARKPNTNTNEICFAIGVSSDEALRKLTALVQREDWPNHVIFLQSEQLDIDKSFAAYIFGKATDRYINDSTLPMNVPESARAKFDALETLYIHDVFESIQIEHRPLFDAYAQIVESDPDLRFDYVPISSNKNTYGIVAKTQESCERLLARISTVPYKLQANRFQSGSANYGYFLHQ